MDNPSESFPPPPLPILRPWRELAVFAYILMELSWVALFYRVLFPTGRLVSYERVLIVLAGILLLSYLSAQVGDVGGLSLRMRQCLLAGVFVIDELLGLGTLMNSYRFSGFHLKEFLDRPASTVTEIADLVPAELFLVLIVFWAWWRGISLVSKQVGPVYAVAGFRAGIVGFFLYGLALPLVGEAPVWSALTIFLFSGLLAMSAARIAVLVHLRGGGRISFNRNWLAGIVLAVLSMAILSSLAALAMRGRVFDLVTQVFTYALYLAAILLAPLLVLFMRLIFLLGERLDFAQVFSSMMSFLYSFQERIQEWLQAFEKMLGDFQVFSAQPLLQILNVLKSALFWAAILLGVLLVLLTLQRRVWKAENEGEQGSEALPMSGNLADLLRAALRRSFSRMAHGLENALRFRRTGHLLAAARIRRIYARLLNLSASLDHPRPAACTPLEFLPGLEALFPGMQSDLATITNAYLRVRYGELSETLQEVEAVEAAWKRIAAEGRARLSTRRSK